uniref:HDC16683 n=1 Tax=Drosophila melanogaster TaxID=7227 RepID=Q6IIX0_DROME|nr:TPA_inf: HDC16683 [Drosophila melanogaster]
MSRGKHATFLNNSPIKIKPFIILVLNLNIWCQYISATSYLSLNDLTNLERPFFDDISPRNVSAVVDEIAILRCRVKNKGNRTVSWMPDNDFQDLKTKKRFYDTKSARAKILGSTEIHVKRDSTIALACSVNIHAPSVIWYHGSSVVDFDSLRGGISLETEKTDVGTTSRLMLTRASLRDSGNYTCVPNGAIPASVRVHVSSLQQCKQVLPFGLGLSLQ